MATNDDLDPAQSQRRANDQLRVAMLQLDEHIQALTAPTMELALIQKKRASELGLEERDPSDLFRKFISQAGPGGHIGVAEPGQLSPDSSTPEKASDAAWRRYLGMGGGPTGGPPTGEQSGPLKGKTNAEAEAIAKQGFTIPQFGDWQIDSLLKLASHFAGGKAVKQYKSQAEAAVNAGEEPLSPEDWAGQQSQYSSWAGASDLASKGASTVAAASLIHKKVLSPLLDIGFGAAHAGASLGYTPQGEGLLGASHILGIPNPLSVIGPWASPGAQQGMGSFVNAAESAFGGTGISFSEANKLREGLAAQGWSNQRAGGFLGATIGGQQENIAKALEPLVKAGFNPEQLASTTNALKLGQATPEELKKTLEQLPEIAKTLHKTLEEVTANMEEFAAKTVENGSTMIHGMQAYGEIARNTGINPLLTQAANEGTFGKVQAAQKGVLPWQITSMTGNQASTNAYAAVKQLSEIAGPGKAVTTTNKYGETETISAEAAKLAMMHQLEPNLTTEYMKRMLQIGPHMEAAASGMHKADQLQAFISQKRHENEAYGPNVHTVFKLDPEITHLQQLKKQGEKEGEGEYGKLTEGQMEDLQRKEKAVATAKHAAAGEGTLNVQQQGNVIAKLPELYTRAREAGLGQHGEIKQWMMESPEKQIKNITAALSKIAEVKPEAQEEGAAKIELTEEAKKWFKLQFPHAKAPKEIAGEGGKSTASSAAQPNTGESAANASLMRQYSQAHRNEPTVGG